MPLGGGIFVEFMRLPHTGELNSYLVYRDGMGDARVIAGTPESFTGDTSGGLEIDQPVETSRAAYGPANSPRTRQAVKLPTGGRAPEEVWGQMIAEADALRRTGRVDDVMGNTKVVNAINRGLLDNAGVDWQSHIGANKLVHMTGFDDGSAEPIKQALRSARPLSQAGITPDDLEGREITSRGKGSKVLKGGSGADDLRGSMDEPRASAGSRGFDDEAEDERGLFERFGDRFKSWTEPPERPGVVIDLPPREEWNVVPTEEFQDQYIEPRRETAPVPAKDEGRDESGPKASVTSDSPKPTNRNSDSEAQKWMKELHVPSLSKHFGLSVKRMQSSPVPEKELNALMVRILEAGSKRDKAFTDAVEEEIYETLQPRDDPVMSHLIQELDKVTSEDIPPVAYKYLTTEHLIKEFAKSHRNKILKNIFGELVPVGGSRPGARQQRDFDVEFCRRGLMPDWYCEAVLGE